MNNKVLNLIGLAKRSNCLVSGEGFVIENIRNGNAKIVFISNDCKSNTYKKLVERCNFYKVEYYVLNIDKYTLGNAIGKEYRVCVAITDEGFKKLLVDKMKE